MKNKVYQADKNLSQDLFCYYRKTTAKFIQYYKLFLDFVNSIILR